MGKKALVNGCMKVERTAVSIYKSLVKKFPDKADFWKELLDDEIEHLSFFNDVKSLALSEMLQGRNAMPPMEEINKAACLAGDIKEQISSGRISFKRSLALALKLEESIVEIYTNRVIADLISCEGESSYKQVMADERKHVKKIKTMMNKLAAAG